MKVLISSGEGFLGKTLARWGYQVETASDANEAFRLLTQKDPPKLAIFDCEMAGMKGPGLCQRLRADSIETYIYIILLTQKSRRTICWKRSNKEPTTTSSNLLTGMSSERSYSLPSGYLDCKIV